LAPPDREATIGAARSNHRRGRRLDPLAGVSHPVFNLARLRRPPRFASLAVAGVRAPAPGADSSARAASAEYVFTRAELQPVLQAIRATVACGAVPLDSPLRLQEALTMVVRGLGGPGDVVVRRSPAALLTPEYWQIVLTSMDGRMLASLAELFRGARR
jgi:hypothetical protein